MWNSPASEISSCRFSRRSSERFRLAVAQHGAIAARVEQQRDLIGERVRAVVADATELVGELQSGRAAFRRQRGGVEGA